MRSTCAATALLLAAVCSRASGADPLCANGIASQQQRAPTRALSACRPLPPLPPPRTLTGGYEQCCTEGVVAQARPCAAYDAPCTLHDAAATAALALDQRALKGDKQKKRKKRGKKADKKKGGKGGHKGPTERPDPYCSYGILAYGNTRCCDAGCTKCGAADCAKDKLGAAACCGNDIRKSHRVCNTKEAPCLVTRFKQKVKPLTVAPGSIRRETTIGVLPGPPPKSLSLEEREKKYGVTFDAIVIYKSIYVSGSSAFLVTPALNMLTAATAVDGSAPAQKRTTVEGAGSSQARCAPFLLPVPSKRGRALVVAAGAVDDSLPRKHERGELSFDDLRPYIKDGKSVQLIIEFNDNNTLDRALQGEYNDRLVKFAQAASKSKGDVSVRMLHEFNGDWYPWGVFRKGNDLATFKKAYKYLVDKLRGEYDGFTFQFSYALQNGAGFQTPIADFYTGLEKHVDEICVSVYNLCGVTYNKNRPIRESLNVWYQQVTSFAPDVNLCIAEMSSTSYCDGKPEWITDTWSDLGEVFTHFTTINWFLENKTITHGEKQRNWDLNSQADIDAFVAGMDEFRKLTAPKSKSKSKA
ncbi:glycoside hydrolase superfamily [Tribonema minus]|uniref:Glycoside hydrolase superfamily n=1 Tax=Tribonema minus TaxID=303371 RepID=A0A835YWI9_9STRA|nr:glycoside hydrolase superfamily [Tribonema minus]